jgi:hypothetical protein
MTLPPRTAEKLSDLQAAVDAITQAVLATSSPLGWLLPSDDGDLAGQLARQWARVIEERPELSDRLAQLQSEMMVLLAADGVLRGFAPLDIGDRP